MILSREAIYAALFAIVSDVPGFVTTSRRIKLWDDVPMDFQPALFMTQKNEAVIQKKGLPSRHELLVDIYIYAKTGEDQDSVPASILNPLVDAVVATLEPDPVTGYFSLTVDGQEISHCWIDGEIINDEGVLGCQAVAIIPVRILAL